MPSISDIRNDVQKLASRVDNLEVRELAVYVERLCKMVQDIEHKADDALKATL
jgi:hypothetical protein